VKVKKPIIVRINVTLTPIILSGDEKRFFCFGKVKGGVMTVRFTDREGIIRIIGAGYWRKGKKIYEKENKIHG
jgi:hypothetical protein